MSIKNGLLCFFGWSFIVLLSCILSLVLPMVMAKSNFLVAIYILLYVFFAYLFFTRKNLLSKKPKTMFFVFMLFSFPCLWFYDHINSDQIGIATLLGSIFDLFFSSAFFIDSGGRNILGLIRNSNVSVLFQIQSILVGAFVFIKLFQIGSNNIKFEFNKRFWFRKYFFTTIVILSLVSITHFFILDMSDFYFKNSEYAKRFFGIMLLYYLCYFGVATFFIFFLKVTSCRFTNQIFILFLWFFPLMSISEGGSIQYTDSMDYYGHYPVFSTFGSSLFNLTNYFFNGIRIDPNSSHFVIVTYNFFELGLAMILFRIVQNKKDKAYAN